MLRNASRTLFLARNRALLVVPLKGTESRPIAGANQLKNMKNTMNDDPAGLGPLQFGKHTNESSMFAQAANAWDAMRKVGSANPIETNIERFEEKYQTQGTGEEAQTQANSPSLWERAKEAAQAVRDTITPGPRSSGEDLSVASVEVKPFEQQEAEIAQLHRTTRPGFADDGTGHRPWNWDMAKDSLRNSEDGMGIIQPVGPSAAEHTAKQVEFSNTQVNDNLKAQQREGANTNRGNDATQAANENWPLDNTRVNAKQMGSATRASNQDFQQAKTDLDKQIDQTKEKLGATTISAKHNLRNMKEDAQRTWGDAKEVASEGIREVGQQLKKGMADLKQGALNVKKAVGETDTSDTERYLDMMKPSRVEESYEEAYNQPPGKGFRAAAERLSAQDLKNAESTTRQEVTKGSSPEHGEKNAQVPKKDPTRYHDFEHGSRATDF